jgi:hypothetical protein
MRYAARSNGGGGVFIRASSSALYGITIPDQVEYVITDVVDLDAQASLEGRQVGYIWCLRDGRGLKIAGLNVVDRHRRQGIGKRG